VVRGLAAAAIVGSIVIGAQASMAGADALRNVGHDSLAECAREWMEYFNCVDRAGPLGCRAPACPLLPEVGPV
jgi:hypothetical protein